jgi:hypothetical protein
MAVARPTARATVRALVVLGLAGGAVQAETATPTRTPFAVCTPPLCALGEVFYCPSQCPGGCGTECVTPAPLPTPTPGQVSGCTLQIGPRGFDFRRVPIGSSDALTGTALLDIQQDSRAIDPITVTLTFDPSPPFFDAAGELRATSTFSLAPGYVDDHLIRCVPTAAGRVKGILTVIASRCPAIVIPLSCIGFVPATPTPTPAPAPACVGDCNGDDTVAINEIITSVLIALGTDKLDACPAIACGGSLVAIDCLIRAVNNALNGCPPAA